jgi:hypothetical protein
MKKVVISISIFAHSVLAAGTNKPGNNSVRYVITSSYNTPFVPKENVLWFSNSNIGTITAKAFSNTNYPLVTVQFDFNKKNIISQFTCSSCSEAVKKGFIRYLEINLGKHGCSSSTTEMIKTMLIKKFFPISPSIERRLH